MSNFRFIFEQNGEFCKWSCGINPWLSVWSTVLLLNIIQHLSCVYIITGNKLNCAVQEVAFISKSTLAALPWGELASCKPALYLCEHLRFSKKKKSFKASKLVTLKTQLNGFKIDPLSAVELQGCTGKIWFLVHICSLGVLRGMGDLWIQLCSMLDSSWLFRGKEMM